MYRFPRKNSLYNYTYYKRERKRAEEERKEEEPNVIKC